MAFGKRGRPPEDRLARQQEIFLAVSPLILQEGARRLSMRHAAQAACLSIGGLYHYFPTKRDLLLHGLCVEALTRVCQDFHAQFGHLSELDPRRYIDEGIGVAVEHVRLCRPSIHAALEFGSDSFWEVIDTLLTSTALNFEVHLRRLVPAVSDQELAQWGQAIRRCLCGAMLDKNVTSAGLHEELRMLIDGYVRHIDAAGHAVTAAPLSARIRSLVPNSV